MTKRFISYVIGVMLIACLLAISFPTTISAESLYIKKIVSVVYDDSGSMKNGNSANWAYASYAMQSFCGLMNSDDRLFVTYMSAAENNPKLNPPEIDLSAYEIQNSVNKIRTHTDYGNTPYNAVEIAFDKLTGVNDSNVNTQYWLVVITDGAFQGGANGDVSKDELNTSLASYSNEIMPNGSNVQITYLAIGDNAIKPNQDINSGIYVYSSSGSSDIINVMAEIADKISGRTRLSAKDIVLADNRTVQISSSVPLLNIAVLSQQTTAKVINAQHKNGDDLIIERSASIKYPERSGWNTDTSLNGGAFLVGNNGESVKSGTYTICFDTDISLNNIVIMYEPALEVRMVMSVNGTVIESLSELNNCYEKDIVNVNCKIYEIGTDNEISPSLLPPNTTYHLGVYENDKLTQKDETSAMSLDGIALGNSQTEIKAVVTIPGFNAISINTGVFIPHKPAAYTLEIKQPDSFTLTMVQLKSNKQKITFIIKADGVQVSKDIAETLDFKIETDSYGDIVMEDDGSISFIPSYPASGDNIKLGKNTVTGILNGTVRKEGTFFLNDGVYSIEVTKPENFSLDMDQLKSNTKKIKFYIKESGVPVTKDIAETLGFSIDTTAPGTVIYEDDGSVSFTPQYKEPVSALPTGEITVTGTLGNGISQSTSFYLKPLEYTVHAIGPEDNTVIRGLLNDNEKGVTFEVFANGVKLDKTAVEAANIKYRMNKPYDEILKYNIVVDNDGTISVSPIFDKWCWLTAYLVPTGELQLYIECNGAEDSGTLIITNDIFKELILNLLIPLLILIIILGELFKKRFKYSARIHFNHGVSSGMTVTGPKNGWNTEGLMTWTAFVPFFADTKKVNGARFYANGPMWNPTIISVKAAQLPEFSGILDSGVNEQESVRFNKNDVNLFEGAKTSSLIYGTALVTSGDRNYKSCQIFLYSEE